MAASNLVRNTPLDSNTIDMSWTDDAPIQWSEMRLSPDGVLPYPVGVQSQSSFPRIVASPPQAPLLLVDGGRVWLSIEVRYAGGGGALFRPNEPFYLRTLSPYFNQIQQNRNRFDTIHFAVPIKFFSGTSHVVVAEVSTSTDGGATWSSWYTLDVLSYAVYSPSPDQTDYLYETSYTALQNGLVRFRIQAIVDRGIQGSRVSDSVTSQIYSVDIIPFPPTASYYYETKTAIANYAYEPYSGPRTIRTYVNNVVVEEQPIPESAGVKISPNFVPYGRFSLFYEIESAFGVSRSNIVNVNFGDSIVSGPHGQQYQVSILYDDGTLRQAAVSLL